MKTGNYPTADRRTLQNGRLTPGPDTGSPRLFRGLGGIDVGALTLNSVIGAGIFALPAALMAAAGTWSLAVLLASFILMALMAMCMVEVASRYDVTGGPMHYASVAFGPYAGFLVGWLMYLSRLAAFGAIAAVMLDYGAGLWPPLGGAAARAVAITIFTAALAALNLRGVVQGALASNLLTVAKGLPLLLIALAGLFLGSWKTGPASPPPSLDGLSRAFLLAFFACMGFEPAAVVAGEMRNPRRHLPVGILGGLGIVGALYALLMFACLTSVPDLANSSRPLADAAKTFFGPAGATAMALTAVFSCAGYLSVSMMVTPRVLYALAVQGDLPHMFAGVDSSSLAPSVAILSSAFLACILTLSGTFVYLATFSVIARMLMYASTCAALIVLRRRDGPAPVQIPWGPACAVLALLLCFIVLSTTSGTGVRDVLIAVVLGWTVRTVVRRSN